MRINFNKNLVVNRADMGGGATKIVTITGQTIFSNFSSGSVTMPSGLAFFRNSPATVQTGTSTLVSSSIDANVAVVGRVLDTDTFGLQHEISSSNVIKDSRDMSTANWAAGTATATYNYAAGPDGAVLADRFNATNTQFSRYIGGDIQTNSIPGGTNVAYSMWQQAVTSSGGYQGYISEPALQLLSGNLTGTSWKRLSLNHLVVVPGSVLSFVPLDARNLGSGSSALARDVVLDYHQIELGGYPTSAIVTTGLAITRAGSRIQYTSPLSRLWNGRLNLELDLRPLGSSVAYSSGSQAMRIWTDATNGNNFIEVNSASLCVSMSISGVMNYTVNSLPPWNANDRLQLFFGAGGNSASRVFAQVGTGSATELTISGSALGMLSPTGSIDLLSDGVTKQFSCWLVAERTYKGL